MNTDLTIHISGQPIDYWIQKFRIKVPTDNLTPAVLRDLDMILLDLHQEATFYLAVTTARAQMLQKGSNSSYYAKYIEILNTYRANGKRAPSADTLESMAKIDNEDVEAAATIIDIETKFWKSILDHLAMARRLIENASLNISVELKALNNESLINHINKSRNEKGDLNYE
jgi:hypothetical protein